MKSLLRTLTETAAPSGKEDELRTIVQQMIQPHADEVRVDALGNLIARKGRQSTKGRRILLAAHLDEIGLVVSHVDAKGFARFSALGGLALHRRVGTRVRFLNGARGVIGLERAAEQKDRAPGIDKYFIDTGAAGAKNLPVKVGDAAVYDSTFFDLGDRVLSKAFDDRLGVALLIETLRTLSSTPHEIDFVFTVQGEVGAHGAGPAAFGLDPEIALALDVCSASDTPNASDRNPIALGHGPAITVKDSGMVADPHLVDVMTRLAEKNHIPHQFETAEAASTDAHAMQIAGAGARAGGLSVPIRNLHSPSEMVDYQDLQDAARLLMALLRSTDL